MLGQTWRFDMSLKVVRFSVISSEEPYYCNELREAKVRFYINGEFRSDFRFPSQEGDLDYPIYRSTQRLIVHFPPNEVRLNIRDFDFVTDRVTGLTNTRYKYSISFGSDALSSLDYMKNLWFSHHMIHVNPTPYIYDADDPNISSDPVVPVVENSKAVEEVVKVEPKIERPRILNAWSNMEV